MQEPFIPPAESLQFRRAEHAPDPALGPQCASCKNPSGHEYYQANGIPVCARCASAIESNTKPAPKHTLLKAFLYGSGAAIAGCALYATVAIVTGLELALIAILIGYMVGKAIRYASPGGRPQQIMAVALTYLAISASYVPVGIYHLIKNKPAKTEAARQVTPAKPAASPAAAIGMLMVFAVAGPFMTLTDASGLISLVIIFFGLQRAWRMTGRPDIVISGPYQAQASA
jgi:hypothetical protein